MQPILEEESHTISDVRETSNDQHRRQREPRDLLELKGSTLRVLGVPEPVVRISRPCRLDSEAARLTPVHMDPGHRWYHPFNTARS
jgi:hypothetical protein